MKQLVNLFARQTKNQGTRSEREPLRRPLRSETLEKRQLLAGDLLPAHNYTIPEDVNGDWQVTPLDALLILNHISRSGGNPSLEGFARGDLEHFVDVTATNDVTPLDALRVMNRIARAEGVDELLQLHINPRTAGDQAFSASAFNAATRELTVGVNEVFHLEVLYTDLRGTFDRTGAFAIYTDILLENAGILEPVLTETQFLTISANLRNADGGTIDFAFPGSPAPITVAFEDFAESQEAPARVIRETIEQLGFTNVSVTSLPGGPTDPFEFLIRYNDFSLADQDIPNLIVTPNLTNGSGASIAVTATVNDVKPRNLNGTINQQAVPLNMNFFSRTFKVSQQFPFGEPFYGFAGTQVGTFSEATGFIDLGATGPLLINGFPDANAGSLPRPFDAFSVPVRMTQEAEDFRIFLDPPNTSATANLFYGRTEPIPNDLIRIDLTVDPNVTTDGSGVLFVTAVDSQQVVVSAPNLNRTATQGGGAVTIPIRDLITVQNGNPAAATVAIVSQPNLGSAAVNAATGVITFTPPADQSGTTTFVYSATVDGVSDTGTVSVTVSPQQQVVVNAPDRNLAAVQGGPAVSIDLRGQVTVQNGSGALPTIAIVNQPSFGSVAVNAATGVATYTPPAGQSGTTTFVYSATVDGVSDTGTVTVTVNPTAITVNAANATLAAVENGGPRILNLAPLVTVTGSATVPTFSIVTQPTRGTALISGTTLTYTPAAGQSGTDTIVYRATVNGVSDTGTVTVNIAPIVAPPVARDDNFNVLADTSTSFTSAQLTGNDSAASPNPSGLAPRVTAATAIGTTQGTVVFNAATGNVTYTPPAGFTGTDRFQYTMTSEGQTATATVVLNVQAFVPSTISGSIFNDFIASLENPVRDGVRSDNEPFVGGVSVRLSREGQSDLVRLTDSEGKYSFGNLAPGRYTVTFEVPNTLIFGSRVNGSSLPVGGVERSFVVDIPAEGGRNFAGLNFTVLGKTGAAAGSSTLLVSQYSRTNPNAPNNIDNPNFGLATMILDTSDGSQQLFELGKGFEDVLFAEIAVGQSGKSAILTVIMADGSVKSAILGENDFLVSSNQAVVHVLRSISSLTFLTSSDELLEAEYGSYRSAVDEILASGNF